MIYLCGGIAGLTDEQCTDWREYAKKQFLIRGIRCLDPMVRDYRGLEDEKWSEIVSLDERDIRSSTGLLVNATKPSWGTAMEMQMAYDLCKPIVSWVGDTEVVSPWVKHRSQMVSSQIDSCIEWCSWLLKDVL